MSFTIILTIGLTLVGAVVVIGSLPNKFLGTIFCGDHENTNLKCDNQIQPGNFNLC